VRQAGLLLLFLFTTACGSSSLDLGERRFPDAATAPRNEAGVIISTTTEAGVTTACTCLQPQDWDFGGRSTCDAPRYLIGCAENPKPGPTTFDLPPSCWNRPHLIDPETGCLMPNTTFCSESCVVRPDSGAPQARDAEVDAGTSTTADAS
jgi:hypothetical protein